MNATKSSCVAVILHELFEQAIERSSTAILLALDSGRSGHSRDSLIAGKKQARSSQTAGLGMSHLHLSETEKLLQGIPPRR